MNNILIFAIVVLVIINLLLLLSIYLYRRQIYSICHQLDIHRENKSYTDIWIDIMSNPFKKLQVCLNNIIKKQIEETTKYKELENSWKELVANVSHDIRTPITSVSGYFQLLCETDDEEKRKRYIEIINGRLVSFQDMLEDFFMYSAVVSKDKKVQLESCNITRTLSEILFLYYQDIQENLGDAKVEFEDEDVYVICDEKALQRVFQNIIKNALVHGTSDFKVRLYQNDSEIVIEFENKTDEPLPDIPNNVFERAYKSDMSRSMGGAGLGLCIAKELIEDFGGTINAYCRENDTFGIVLTLKKVVTANATI